MPKSYKTGHSDIQINDLVDHDGGKYACTGSNSVASVEEVIELVIEGNTNITLYILTTSQIEHELLVHYSVFVTYFYCNNTGCHSQN